MDFEIYCVHSDNLINQFNHFKSMLSNIGLNNKLKSELITTTGTGRGLVGDELWYNAVLEKLYKMKDIFLKDTISEIGVLSDLDVEFFYKDSIDKLLHYMGNDICFMQNDPFTINSGFFIFHKNDKVKIFFDNLVDSIKNFTKGTFTDQDIINNMLKNSNGCKYNYNGKSYDLIWSVFPENLASLYSIKYDNLKTVLVYHAATGTENSKLERLEKYRNLINKSI